jgi:hypothetical protein
MFPSNFGFAGTLLQAIGHWGMMKCKGLNYPAMKQNKTNIKKKYST